LRIISEGLFSSYHAKANENICFGGGSPMYPYGVLQPF